MVIVVFDSKLLIIIILNAIFILNFITKITIEKRKFVQYLIKTLIQNINFILY